MKLRQADKPTHMNASVPTSKPRAKPIYKRFLLKEDNQLKCKHNKFWCVKCECDGDYFQW